jgi:hypothetical protein
MSIKQSDNISIQPDDILKQLDAIKNYVVKNIKPLGQIECFLEEIILLPEVPFYVIARFMCENSRSVCDQNLNKMARLSYKLLQKGIFCVFRPKNLMITDQDVKAAVNKKIEEINKNKKAKYREDYRDYSSIAKKIRALTGLREDEAFIWEVEIGRKKTVIRLIGPKKEIKIKNKLIEFEFIEEISQIKEAERLISLAEYCITKKLNLINFLYC